MGMTQTSKPGILGLCPNLRPQAKINARWVKYLNEGGKQTFRGECLNDLEEQKSS